MRSPPTLLLASLVVLGCDTAKVADVTDSHADITTDVATDSATSDLDGADVPDIADVTSEVTWHTALVAQPESFLAIWGNDPTDVWVVGMGGIAIHGGPGGWRQLDLRAVDPSFGGLRDVHGPDGDSVWMVGDEGRAFRFDRMQGRAESVYTATAMRLNAVWGTGYDVWAVGGPLSPATGSPVIVKLDRFGSSLQALPEGLPSDAALTDVWGTSASDVWAVGEKGMLLHWDGSSWTAGMVTGAPSLSGVFSLEGEVAAVGSPDSGAELFLWTPASAMFARVALIDPAPLNAVVLGDDGSGWAVGALGRMFERQAGASAWEAHEPFAGAYWNDVWVDARGDLWVAGAGIVRLGPARGDIASGPLVRLDEPVVEEEPDVEVVETSETVDFDTSTIPPPWGFEIGTAVPTDPTQFTAWVNDQAVPVHHGPQGGFHLEVYVRFPFASGMSELATAVKLELFIDGKREGFVDTPSYPVPAQSAGVYQTYPMTLPWDCSLSFTCDSSVYDGKTAVVVAHVGPPGQSWTGSLRFVLDDTW